MNLHDSNSILNYFPIKKAATQKYILWIAARPSWFLTSRNNYIFLDPWWDKPIFGNNINKNENFVNENLQYLI